MCQNTAMRMPDEGHISQFIECHSTSTPTYADLLEMLHAAVSNSSTQIRELSGVLFLSPPALSEDKIGESCTEMRRDLSYFLHRLRTHAQHVDLLTKMLKERLQGVRL